MLELQAVVVVGMLASAVALAAGEDKVAVAGVAGFVTFWAAGCGLTLARWFAS